MKIYRLGHTDKIWWIQTNDQWWCYWAQWLGPYGPPEYMHALTESSELAYLLIMGHTLDATYPPFRTIGPED